MRKIGVCAVLAAIGMMAAAGDAFAVIVDCSTPTALLTAFGSGGTANTTYSIINGPCTGGIAITQDNISILGGAGQTITAGTRAGVTIMGASNILLQNLTIQNAPGLGVEATNGASVSVLFSTVSGNMAGGVSASGNSTLTFGNGTITSASGSSVGPAVDAELSSSVIMKSLNMVTGPDSRPTILVDQSSAVSIGAANTISTSSASTAGPAIVALRSSSVKMASQSTVTGPTNNPTILVDQNSMIFIDPGTTISTSTAMGATPGPAIVALKSSSVTLDGATVNGPSANHTILAAQASSLLLHDTTVTAATPFVGSNPLAVLTATGSSSAVLAGGNTITNSAPIPMMGPHPAAVIVSDGSSLIDVNGTLFGFAAGLDTINGDGKIFTQSVIELATASGVGVDWTGNISAVAASSFRADGGSVNIIGTLTLNQAANGYFNHQNGATNNISPNGIAVGVVCKSTTDHVVNPAFVTPNVTIGSPPGCALF